MSGTTEMELSSPPLHITTRPEDTTMKKELPQTINLLSAVAIMVGTIVGTGIFMSPHVITKNVGSVGMSLVVWLLCGVFSEFASMCYLELGLMLKKSGGEYAYIQHIYGNRLSYVLAVVGVFLQRAAGSAIVAVTFATYLLGDGHGHWAYVLASLGLVWATTVLNCFSTNSALQLQRIFFYIKLILVAIIIFAGLIRITKGHIENLQDPFQNTSISISSISLAFYGGLWPYEGWNSLNYLTEEVIDPPVTMKWALLMSIPIVTVIYMLVNIAYFTVHSASTIIHETAVALSFGDVALGPLHYFIPYLVCISAAGTFNGGLLTNSRFIYSAARDGNLPTWFSLMNPHRQTPVMSLVVNGIITSLYIIPPKSNFDSLLELFGFVTWTVYALLFFGIMWLRRLEPNTKRPFRVFILLPLLAMLTCVGLVLIPLIATPQMGYLYVVVMVLCSFILHYFLIERGIVFVTRANANISDFLSSKFNLIKPEGEFSDVNQRGLTVGAQSTYQRFD